MSIGTNIFTLRKEKELTQSQLAEKLGVSEQAVSKWENDVCTPDVSLFPVIAKLFGVSIDRIFGFHLDTYETEVTQILKAADDAHDTRKEIEILEAGIKKYPNSDRLKTSLAFSLLMIYRISEDEGERRTTVARATSLCNEVIATCRDVERTDEALEMLARIYIEIGEYEKALECSKRISAERVL